MVGLRCFSYHGIKEPRGSDEFDLVKFVFTV